MCASCVSVIFIGIFILVSVAQRNLHDSKPIEKTEPKIVLSKYRIRENFTSHFALIRREESA